MVYTSLFLISLFFIFNGFCIGNLLKKARIFINQYFSTITGILVFLGFFQLLFTFMYLIGASIEIYYYFIGIIQILLLCFYGVNYKTVFAGIRLTQWGMFLLFFVIALAFNSIYPLSVTPDNLHSSYAIGMFNFLNTNSLGLKDAINLVYVNNDFSTINIFTIIFAVLFKINGWTDALIFFRWSYTILFSLCTALIFQCLFRKKSLLSNWYKVIAALFEIFFLAMNYVNAESSILGKCWFGIIIGYFWYTMFCEKNKENNVGMSLAWLAFISFTSFSLDGALFSLCLITFAILYKALNRGNTFSFFIGCALIIALQIINWFYILNEEIWWIVYDIVIILLFTILAIQIGKRSNYRFVSLLTNTINENIKAIYFIIGALIYFVSIYWIVNYGSAVDYYLFRYDYIWTIKLTDKALMILNICLWSFYVCSVGAWVIYMICKKRAVHSFVYYLFMLIFFINPIAMHILRIMFDSFYSIDLSLINYLLIFPALFELEIPTKKGINEKTELNKELWVK